MSETCSWPPWAEEHATACLEQLVFQWAPAAACLVSAFTLMIGLMVLAASRRSKFKYRLVNDDDESVAEAHGPVERIAYTSDFSPSRLIIEVVLLLVNLGAEFVTQFEMFEAGGRPLSAPVVTLKSYMMFLFLVRGTLRISQPRNVTVPVARIQAHVLALYVIQLFGAFLAIFLMAVDDTVASMAQIHAQSVLLAVPILLVLVHITAPRRVVLDSRTNPSPSRHSVQETSSMMSQVTFHWMLALLWKAYRSKLETEDLYELDRKRTTRALTAMFHAGTCRYRSLLRRLFIFLFLDMLKQGLYAALMSLAVFGPALSIRALLDYLESPNSTITNGVAWLVVFGLLASGVIYTIGDCLSDWRGAIIGTKIRALLVHELYSKVTRLNARASSDDGVGKIINLISSDIETVAMIGSNLHLMWVVFPVQTGIATYLLYRIVGLSGLFGVVLMALMIPINVLMTRQQAKAARSYASASDSRIQVNNEVIQNIRTIKYSAWENTFRENIMRERRKELKAQRWRLVWMSINNTFFFAIPLFVTIFTFFFYTVVFGNKLLTARAFPALAIFTILRIPLSRIAETISMLMTATVAFHRMETFLQRHETRRTEHLQYTEMVTSISIDLATFAWPRSDALHADEFPATSDIQASPDSFRLRDIDVRFREGGLNVVSGPSGSGKSSLLLSLIGEMDVLGGNIYLPAQDQTDSRRRDSSRIDSNQDILPVMAYCPQEPWIMNESIRANILFGLPFVASRYRVVLHATALDHDIENLDRRDMSLAGENGSRLSGGQKQRVALARALYSSAKYVILDDCLSALDHRTANHVFFHALRGPMLHGRTCILATHAIHLVSPFCDYMVLLDAGTIRAKGAPAELVRNGIITLESEDDVTKPSLPQWYDEWNPSISPLTGSESNIMDDQLESTDDFEHDESKSEGAVSWAVVYFFVGALGSMKFWILASGVFVMQQLAALGTNIWVKDWAREYDKQIEQPPGQVKEIPVPYYMGVYVGICLLYIALTLLRDLVTMYGGLRAASRIFEELLGSLLHARLLFFDRVPLGQITNRLARDMKIPDNSITFYWINGIQITLTIVTTLMLISFILPAFLFAAVLIILTFWLVMLVFINASRDLKRMESLGRSPLYQQLGETLTGCVSIRAYGNVARSFARNGRIVDHITNPLLLESGAKQWLTFWVGSLGSLIQFATGAFILWRQDLIAAGVAGLVLTYAANFTENVLWFVQVYAMMQKFLTSIERIYEYTKIEQEPDLPLVRASRPPPPEWPAHGTVTFRDYSTRYAPDLDLVLRDVSFEAPAGKRFAIVGRTGAGKSTLAMTLIRGLEAASGQILIDDIDIAGVQLAQLRRAITVVTQDPMLFGSSVRENMDPVQQFSDAQILQALHSVRFQVRQQADRSVAEPTDPTTTPTPLLSHPATSLSRGQRQLLCIARALLQRKRILLLDEATASIDHLSDAEIQHAIRALAHSGTTILTIAHRLATIADYDHVVVLDAGRVVESGKPQELLAKDGPAALFRRLCEESGDAESIARVAAGAV